MTDSFSSIFSNSVTENIKCFVRCRPLNDKEHDLGVGCIKINEESKTISIDNKTDSKAFENKTYNLDYVFSGETKQEEIFERLAVPILKGFFQGYNCTIFAYGQTGSGKTHTMLGPLESVFSASSEHHGLIPRILHYIFNTLETNLDNARTILNETKSIKNIESEVSCSCLEIYQEQIIDLLATMTTSNLNDDKLAIREDGKRGMFIDGLTENIAKNDKSAMAMLMLGLKNRHVAATNMNAESSRSHLIFTIFMNLSYTREDGSIISRSSRLHLIDLAGSERQKATKAVGERIKEAGMINKSLSTLGNVINALVWLSEGKSRYVPFRDSKLTYFLKDSLGGNAKTSIISNISQSVLNLPETISTLKFVQRAKMIKNKAFINEKVNDEVKLLQEEVRRLRDEIVTISYGKLNSEYNLNPNPTLTGVNYVCSECKNKTENCFESSNDRSNGVKDLKTDCDINSRNLENINNSLNDLMVKIISLLVYEDELSEKFKLIDTMTASTIENFFVSKQIYESDSTMYLDSLEKKIKQFNNVLKFKDNILNEVKEELVRFKKDNFYDQNFVEKILNFTNELIEFKQDFELNQILSLTKLNEENKLLRSELEAMKYLKEYFQNLNKNSENQKLFFDKLNVDRMYNITKDFIQSNEDVKTFFIENFARTDSEDNSVEKFIIISKNEFELIKFQLEELKINEENNLKMIDELNSENFLMDMELARYREKEKEEGEREAENEERNFDRKKSTLSNSKLEANTKITESIHANNSPVTAGEFADSTPQKRSGNLIQLAVPLTIPVYNNSSTILEEKEKNMPINSDDSASANISLDKDTHTGEKPSENILNDSTNLISATLVATERINVIESDTKSKHKNQLINNLRKSFAHTSPMSKALRSSLLHTARTPRLNSNRDSNDENSHIHNLININNPSYQFDPRFSVDIKPLSIENFEFLKLKQKLDDALINLEDKEIEISDKIQEIEESKGRIEELTNEKERIHIILDQQNEEIETISESNRFLQIDLISLNRKTNLLSHHNEELISALEEISLELCGNDVGIAELGNMFSRIFTEHVSGMKEKILNSPCRIGKLVAEEYLYFSTAFTSQIECVFKEVNNSMIFNEIKIEKIKSQLNTLGEDANASRLDSYSKIKELEEEKLQYSEKMSMIKKYFGDGFDFDFTNPATHRPFTWKIDKTKFNKSEKKVLELKEEKTQLKCDIALLKLDFNKSLSDKALDSKIHLLMKIKEENHNLKLELIEMKKKNETYEKTITNLQDMMNKLLTPYVDEYGTNNNSVMNFSGNQPVGINFEDAIKIRREHKELIEYIFQIGFELRASYNSNLGNIGIKEEKKNKFNKAMDILKTTQDALNTQMHKFVGANVSHVDTRAIGGNKYVNANATDTVNSAAVNKMELLLQTNTKIKNEIYTKKNSTNVNENNTHFSNSAQQSPSEIKNENKILTRNKSSNKNKNDLSLTPTKTVKNKDYFSKKSQIESKTYLSNNKSVTKKIVENKNLKTTQFKNAEESSPKINNLDLSNTPIKKKISKLNVNLNNPNVKTIKIDIKANLKSAGRSNSNATSNK